MMVERGRMMRYNKALRFWGEIFEVITDTFKGITDWIHQTWEKVKNFAKEIVEKISVIKD